MRKMIVFITLLCLLCTLAVGVNAATAAKSISSYATVSSDGSCQITLTANIHLDSPVDDLTFPLPENAGNITINGVRARSKIENGLRQVDVSKVVGKAAGDFTLTFTYSLPDLVKTNEAGLLELQLPLLSGFPYPVQALEFSVTLPGEVTAKPAFSSGYHQANIEKDIYCTTSGATVTGIAQVELKDHETLKMSLTVSEDMFPQTRIKPPDFQTVNMVAMAFFLLALLYWALFLRNLPAWPHIQPESPDGYSAGELGSVLHLRGGDLHMMVFSWAQLGYLLIRLQPDGSVMLCRQMEMGNERSSFEQRCFKLLFGRRSAVNASSRRYGAVYRAVEKLRPNLSALMHPKSGNLHVFRGLAAVTGLLCGVSVGVSLSEGAALQWLLIIALGGAGLLSGYRIQLWAGYLFTSRRRPLWIAVALSIVWLALSVLAGQLVTGIGMVLSQLFAGVLAAIGGRRTLAGRQAMGQALGLRRYLKSVPTEQLRMITQNNPEYFHQMMPYAMALGVDKAFAKQFGKLPIGQCPYISVGADSTMRAAQWRSMMRRILGKMNTLPEQTRTEKFLALLESLRR